MKQQQVRHSASHVPGLSSLQAGTSSVVAHLRRKLATIQPHRHTLARASAAGALNAGSHHQSPNLPNFRVAVFSAQQYVRDFYEGPMLSAFPGSTFLEARLDPQSALLAQGHQAVSVFVNDDVSAETVAVLADLGVKLITLRCAGFDKVDLEAAAQHGMKVVRVPTYSPQSVAEHAVALMFALNRNITSASQRTSQGNYTLSGLIGFEMYRKKVGIIGTGAIGTEACRILKGIGCEVFANDIHPSPAVEAMGIPYMSLDELLPQCDIVSLHCPLLPSTQNLMDRGKIMEMKHGAMLINVSRGGLVDSDALTDALESGQLGALGLDVYDNETSFFFTDFTMYSTRHRMKNWDRKLKALMSFPQVIITPHSAFLTKEALQNIAASTIASIKAYVANEPLGIAEVKYQSPALPTEVKAQ